MPSLLHIGLPHYVALSLIVFAAGVAAMLTKRHAIGILIGVELVLNAAAINFVAFNHYAWDRPPATLAAAADAGSDPPIHGQMFTLFIVVLAAAEAAVALAIFLNFSRHFEVVDVDRVGED